MCWFRAMYEKESFDPGIVGLFVNPFYFARKGLIGSIREFANEVEGKILDVGCGQKPYQRLFTSSEYIGLELDTPANREFKRADLYYDGRTLPFAVNMFDSIICNQVLEHVPDPHSFLSEIQRVLKVNGTLLLTVPFMWDEHEQPHDYARYSFFGLRYLLNVHGFTIIEHRKTMADLRAIFQLINGYLYKKTVTTNGYLNLLSTMILISPFNVLGEILSHVMPGNEDLYLDNVVLARKVAV
jgi:SAM-dependent methyltransferase